MTTVNKNHSRRVDAASKTQVMRFKVGGQERASIELADSGFQHEMTKYNSGQQKYLTINLSDLKLGLRDFKNAVRNSELLSPTIGTAGIWAPLITSDFKGYGSISPGTVKGGYFALAAILSFFLFRNIVMTLRTKVARVLKKSLKYRMKYEVDPDSLADLFCEADETAKKESKVSKGKEPSFFTELLEIIRIAFGRIF